MIHLGWCSPDHYRRLSAGETLKLAYPWDDYHAGDQLILVEKAEGEHGRLVADVLEVLTQQTAVPRTHQALCIRKRSNPYGR